MILTVHKNTYARIEPIHIPTNLQPYLGVALLQPKSGSKILTASIYISQLHTPQGQLMSRDLLRWLTQLLSVDYPSLPILMGGDSQATPQPNHKSHSLPLEELCQATSLAHIGNPHTPTFTPTNSPLDHWFLRLFPTTHSHYENVTTTTSDTYHNDHMALTQHISQIGDATRATPPPNTHFPSPLLETTTLHTSHPQTPYRPLPTVRCTHPTLT